MARMSPYCKVYPASRLRQFPAWTEAAAPFSVDERDYFFVHSDYTVTSTAYLDEDVVFTSVSDDWKRFCREVLAFAAPSLPLSDDPEARCSQPDA
jgi:hypothetical protein